MNRFSSPKCVLCLSGLVAFVGLLLLAACGNGGNSLPQVLGGNYSNQSLKGQYVISQTGIGVNQANTGSNAFSETIVFTADGNGNLNITVDDFDQVGGPFPLHAAIPGTYGINKDGTGFLQFNFGGGSNSNYTITMIDDKHFYVIEQDLFATASGFGEMQDTTAFSAPPSGTFVFRAHNVDASSRVGSFTVTAGAINITEDLLNLGSTSFPKPVVSTVSMSTPNASGSGGFALSDGTSFNYYVVNSSKFYIMSNSASGSLEIGQAEAQTSVALAAGSYVFGSGGDTSVSTTAGIHSAGVFTTDGSGNILPNGAVDYVQDTTVNSNLSVTGGGYAVGVNGRGTVSLTLAGGVIPTQIFWMVNANRAYFLMDSNAAVEDGIFTLQQGAPFSAVGAQAAFVMDGFDSAFKDRTGAFEPTTGNNFKWTQSATSYSNAFFPPTVTLSSTNTPFTGTFQVSSNGRVAVNVSNVTPSLVFYLSSASSGVMVQEDANIGGAFTVQAGQ